MGIIGNINSENKLPSSVTVLSGASVVPVGKYWKIKNYSEDSSIAGVPMTRGTIVHSGSGPTHIGNSGTNLVNTYQCPIGGTIEHINLYASTPINSNYVVNFYHVVDGIDIYQIASLDVNAKGDGYNTSTTIPLNRKVKHGDFIKIFYIFVGPVLGGNVNGSFSCSIAEDRSSGEEIVVPAGVTVSGYKYTVEEYDL